MKAKTDVKLLTKSNNTFPVVGIGASAGGLDAFKKIIKAIPENSGMAYVLVQHLDPNHESILASILQKFTPVPVLEITDDIKVKPDHVYIIPSNKMLIANDGVLEISPRPLKNKKDRNLPIDLFFASLAEIHQQQAIGVVLSGTGSDGTEGLKAIKAKGGLTFAQDQASAAYGEMPASAVRAGVVDTILPPDEIPLAILAVFKEKKQHLPSDLETLNDGNAIHNQILAKLRLRKGTDFSHYKQTTIKRRILRRKAFNKMDSSSYLEFLTNSPAEQDILYQDLLIPVTHFFRDARSFQYLTKHVIPVIIDRKAPEERIRIWSAACSTGEEAYSLAISFVESMGALSNNITVFATDISEPAIAKARAGIYSQKELHGVSASRLKEFFVKTKDSYQVSKRLRDMCIFARHDFLRDPPFLRMDLISCRNVLIYLDASLQQKALTTFHYALAAKGFLFLGRTETAISAPSLFQLAKKNEKIFIRNDRKVKYNHLGEFRKKTAGSANVSRSNPEPLDADFRKIAEDLVVSHYAPPGVIVNDNFEIVHFRGSTSEFLEQLAGAPSHNLLKMVKPELGFDLRNLLHKAKKQNKHFSKANIHFESLGINSSVTLEVIPLPGTTEPYFLVLFQKVRHVAEPGSSKTNLLSKKNKNAPDHRDEKIAQMQIELTQTHDDMRSIADDQEATNEELQSDNEELLSSSEELQSLNEELETSKEELQSSNEELLVVNQEMISLNEQLQHAWDYAETIISSTRDPFLVLDHNFRIKSANRRFYEKFRLGPQETEARSFFDLDERQWDILPLRALLEKVAVQGETFLDFEVSIFHKIIGYHTMVLNARPMRGEGPEERLILLSMEDVTEKANATRQIQEFQQLHQDQLEEKVLQRTRELVQANESLEQKNVELANINKELDSFAYISSHDMQEPLRKIQTFAGLILTSDKLSDVGNGYFRKIQAAAARMRLLIDDLLSFSRVSHSNVSRENVDLSNIVREVVEDLSDMISEKKAILKVSGLSVAHVMRFQFHQLFSNLISNSLKFSRPGVPPVIVVQSTTQFYSGPPMAGLHAGEEYCHISVEDNGIGFEPAYSNKIFEVFQRLHSKSTYAGTGIGLAIVKKIVENHGGTITATSQLNLGARFDIFLPIKSVNES